MFISKYAELLRHCVSSDGSYQYRAVFRSWESRSGETDDEGISGVAMYIKVVKTKLHPVIFVVLFVVIMAVTLAGQCSNNTTKS